MIDWLYQTTLSLSLLIGLVLIIRKPVSKYLGANIVYWLWIIPLIRFFSWNTSELPVALVETVDLLDGKILIRVIDNHNIYGVTSLVTFELVWVLGLIVWLLLRTIGWLKLQNNLKTNSSEIDIVQILPDAKALINNSKASFYMTDIPQAPFVTGLISSRIYLPKESFKNYNKIQKICILKHELTHLQRKDLWVQILVEIIRAIFWFNPIVHIAWSAFRHDQELACDYQVLAKSNKNEKEIFSNKKSSCKETQRIKEFINCNKPEYNSLNTEGSIPNKLRKITRIPTIKINPSIGMMTKFDKKNNPGN